MAVVETFSKRQRRLRGDVPDVYVYNELPEPLRVQITQILLATFGQWSNKYRADNEHAQTAYKGIVHTLRREYGMFSLNLNPRIGTGNELAELQSHILYAPVERVLDACELACQEMASRRDTAPNGLSKKWYGDAVDELNTRFREQGIGYEFANGQFVRIDSALVHSEAVKPALALLGDPLYAGAQEEFLSAYDHYRSGNTKEAMTDALKAIESTMKVILTKRGWPYGASDPVKKLIAACFANGLVPSYWQAHFTSLQQMLESSVPTARNKASGHGQGTAVQQVPDFLAGYVLHMTASTIVFLVNAEKALP